MSAKVAIVGAGPSGCYLAQALVKARPDTEVTVIDRLPVPYGLIRYGVAADHQGTKNVIRQFARLFEKQGVAFVGNLYLGRDLSLEDLRGMMDAVVLCTGLAGDRGFDLPGNNLPGIYGAGAITRYWNGHPDSEGFAPEFGQRVAILGNGNVAVDILRLLAKGAGDFDKSDFDPAHVCDGVREIHLIGRAPLAQARFDPAMIREVGALAGVSFRLAEGDDLGAMDTPNRAVLETMLAQKTPTEARKQVVFHSGWQLAGFDEAAGRLGGLRLRRGDTERVLACDSAVTAIGFDHAGPLERTGLLAGAESVEAGVLAPGLFAAGWFRRGPTGTIAENRSDAQGVAKSVLASLGAGQAEGRAALLRRFGDRITGYDDWKAIDAAEIARAPEGRVRLKLSTYQSLSDHVKSRRQTA